MGKRTLHFYRAANILIWSMSFILISGKYFPNDLFAEITFGLAGISFGFFIAHAIEYLISKR